MSIGNVDIKINHKRVGSDYYTAGNPYLLTNYKGEDLKANYPFGESSSLEIGYQVYKDNLDGEKSFTKRTGVWNLKLKLALPNKWPHLRFGYRERGVTSNEIVVESGSGRKRYDDTRRTLSLGLRGKLTKTTWNLNLQKTYLNDDSEYTAEYDHEFLTSSLAISSQLLKNRLNLMLNLSDRIFENKTAGVREEETLYSILRLKVKLIPRRLNISTHYNYSANIKDGSLRPKEMETGLLIDYYLSTRQSLSLDYAGKENKENGYQVHTIGLKYTTIFGIAKEAIRPLVLKVLDDGDHTRDKTGLHASWSQAPKIVEYQYAIGTSPGEVDILGWTSAGKETRVGVTDLSLVDGKTYYVNVRAKKRRFLLFPYWQTIGSSDGITVDFTPPIKPVVTDGGNYTTTNKELYFKWSSSDQVSGIKEYLYALGTTPKGADVLGWRSAGAKEELALTDLNLKDGQIYHFFVKAKDLAGNESQTGSSDGIIVDATPPSIPVVTDEAETSTDTTSLHATWSSQDNESGIIEYKFAIGTSPEGVDVVGWTPSKETKIEASGLTLLVDKTYYVSVKAMNKAGLWSEAGISDGITISKVEIQEIIEEEMPLPEITPTTPTEVPKEELNFFGEGNVKMAVQAYYDPEYVKLYVHLENVSNRTIYLLFRDFTLETREGNRYKPDLIKTIGIEKSFFTTGEFSPNSKAEGFIIFNTQESPKTLIYQNSLGNEISIKLP